MATAQGEDSVGTAHRPKHSGLFETGTNDGLARCLNDARAYEEVVAAELGIAHALTIPPEVVRLGADLLCQFGMLRRERPQGLHELFDFAFVQQALLVN